MDVILERILEEKAKELEITKGQAVEIYKSVFSFIRDTTSKTSTDDPSSFKSVYIKDLGVFYPKLIVAEKIEEAKRLKREKDEDI
jgi:hypothetical protein